MTTPAAGTSDTLLTRLLHHLDWSSRSEGSPTSPLTSPASAYPSFDIEAGVQGHLRNSLASGSSTPGERNASNSTGTSISTTIAEAGGAETGSQSLPQVLMRQLTRQPSSALQATEEESPAAAAERHRLSNSNVLDLRAASDWLEYMMPFVGLLGTVFLYTYCGGIVVFLWLLTALAKLNQLVRKQVSLRKDFHQGDVLASTLCVATGQLVALYMIRQTDLYRLLIFKTPSANFTVWDTVFTIMLADSFVRFCGVLPKLVVVLAVQGSKRGGLKGHRHQARVLTWIEYALTLYRSLLPISLWCKYLLQAVESEIVCAGLTGCYLTLKAVSVLRHARLLKIASLMVLRRGALYGKYVSMEQVLLDGSQCPVCHDTCSHPVELECSHRYCESCIEEWLERDRTCPMCRCAVKPPGLQSFGDGSTSLLPLIF